jgi:hypothetical protein
MTSATRTPATSCVPASIPRSSVSAWGMHGSAFTMDTYSHVLPGMQEEAARQVDVILGPAVSNAHGGT